MAEKKRHHGSKHHKLEGMYEGHSERRHREMRDAGMISEDKSAIANMPQMVEYKGWPGHYNGFDSHLDDTIEGINRQQREDESVAKRHNAPKKW